jgi:hypothetical protein
MFVKLTLATNRKLKLLMPSNPYTTLKVNYPDWLDKSDRRAFLDDCITTILERTAEGKGAYKKGRGYQIKDFPEYTEEYAEEKGSSFVDLELDGDMLQAIDVLDLKNGIIGIAGEQEGKAEGNIRGTYGKRKPIPGKARPFLGLSRSELNIIEAGFIREQDE